MVGRLDKQMEHVVIRVEAGKYGNWLGIMGGVRKRWEVSAKYGICQGKMGSVRKVWKVTGK